MRNAKEAAIALQEVPLVQEEVQSLKAENIGFREELAEMRALITSLNTALTTLETKVKTVSATVELLQSEPTIPKAGSSTADTLNRPEFHQTHSAPNADATQRNSGRRGCGRRGSRQLKKPAKEPELWTATRAKQQGQCGQYSWGWTISNFAQCRIG